MLFATQDGDVGGPPGFEVVGRARAWGVVFKTASETVMRPNEPVVEDCRGGEWWRMRDYNVSDNGQEHLPVGVVPPEGSEGRNRGRAC